MAGKILIILALIGVVGYVASFGGIPGGLTSEKPMNDEVRKIVSNIEDQIKAQESTIEKIEPISYKTQVVAGTNYFIKARVYHSDNTINYVHLRVYKSLEDDLELHGLRTNLDENVELVHFDQN